MKLRGIRWESKRQKWVVYGRIHWPNMYMCKPIYTTVGAYRTLEEAQEAKLEYERRQPTYAEIVSNQHFAASARLAAKAKANPKLKPMAPEPVPEQQPCQATLYAENQAAEAAILANKQELEAQATAKRLDRERKQLIRNLKGEK